MSRETPVEAEFIAEYNWPSRYWHWGDAHDWDDLPPADEDGEEPNDDGYTYRHLAIDEAAARGYDLQMWLDLNAARQVDEPAPRRGSVIPGSMVPASARNWYDDDPGDDDY